jgi:predicted dinucleotide-binding enzyme
MKIGILGSAEVGQALGHGFLQEGYEVMLGTRDVQKEEVVQWKTAHPGARTGNFSQTAAFGEILVLACPGSAVEAVVDLAGREAFSGKIVIDATNPIAPGGPVDGVLKFFTTLEDSLLERTQRLLPQARLVKAFNSVGNYSMYKPDFPGGPPTMFICGNDAAARGTVTDILTRFGWETEDLGVATAARAIEPLCLLWCIPGFLRNDWVHAYKVLRPASV